MSYLSGASEPVEHPCPPPLYTVKGTVPPRHVSKPEQSCKHLPEKSLSIYSTLKDDGVPASMVVSGSVGMCYSSTASNTVGASACSQCRLPLLQTFPHLGNKCVPVPTRSLQQH